MNEEAIREWAIRVAKVSKHEFRLSVDSDAIRAIAGQVEPILRDLVRSEVQATARRCAEIAQGYALCDDVPALHGIDIGKAAASAIRQEFKL